MITAQTLPITSSIIAIDGNSNINHNNMIDVTRMKRHVTINNQKASDPFVEIPIISTLFVDINTEQQMFVYTNF